MRGGLFSLSKRGVCVESLESRVLLSGTTAGLGATISAPNITTGSTADEPVTVAYSDASAIDLTTIAAANIVVNSANTPALTVRSASVAPGADPTTFSANYLVEAPAGGWTSAANGTYTIALQPNQIKDALGNLNAAASGSFSVAVPAVTAPTASIAAPVITPGATTADITVTYTDNVAMNASSIAGSNLTVTAADGTALPVKQVQTSPQGNATSIVATYTIAAPNGAWDSRADGTYTIAYNGAVTNTSKLGAPAATSTFSVNLAAVDTTPPSATISAADVTAAGAANETVTVTFTDDVAVDVSSINASTIVASGPGGTLPVLGMNLNPTTSSGVVTATYTLGAPNGSWNSSDNGTYTVTLNPSQFSDTSHNAGTAAPGAFDVKIASAPSPTPPPASTDFGGGTGVQTSFVAEAVTNTSDGKVYVAGHEGNVSTGQMQAVLERLNSDGSLDRSFGTNGQVVSPAGLNDGFFAVSIQGANHLVVAGTSNGNFVLARYDLSGKLDASFGSAGRVTVDLGSADDTAYSTAFAPNGSIVAVGAAGGNFAFARFDANGHVDTSFAKNGLEIFNSGTTGDVLGSVAVQADGKIIAVGAAPASSGNGNSGAVVRLNANGNPDGTFGSNGLLLVGSLSPTQNSDGPGRSEGLALLRDGSIAVADRTSSGNFGIVHLGAAGTIDTAFGLNGLATVDFGGDDDADALFQAASGAILAVGTTDAGGPKTAVAALDLQGHLIPSFGTGGKLTLAADTSSSASRELHIGDLVLHAFGFVQADGQLLVGSTNGSTVTTTTSTLHRLAIPAASTPVQGTLLGTFGQSGKKNTRFVFTEPDGTQVTFILRGGSGTATQSGSAIDLDITDLGHGASLTITAGGGSAAFTLGNVNVSGSLRTLAARSANLTGTLAASGSLGRVSLGNVSGTIASVKIASLTASSLNAAKVLAGANLGSDGLIGGNSSAADSFTAGSIGTLRVSGAISGSLVAAGLNGATLSDSSTENGGTGSMIRSIFAGSADDSTRFAAGTIRSARLPGKVIPAGDSRFRILA